MRLVKHIVTTAVLAGLLSACDGSSSSRVAPPVAVPDTAAPTVATINNADITANGISNVFTVAVSDDTSANTALTVAFTSSNEAIVPTANVVGGIDGDSANFTLAPVTDRLGSTTITVAVTDEAGNTAEQSFDVTVSPQTVDAQILVRSAFARGANEAPVLVNAIEVINPTDNPNAFSDLLINNSN